ncbi:NADPH oxidase [Entophlyctis helioformis]|nr:NADPH oxidase [Entophlyctis helioformis]
MVEFNRRLVTFHLVFWGIHALIFAYGFMKQKLDPELAVLNSIGYSVYTSRGAGLVLGVDCAALLLPVCRNVVRAVRSSFINRYVPIDENLYFHKWLAYSMLFFSLVHTNAHYTNFFFVETKLSVLGLKAWMVHYLAWGGATGHVMLFIMFLMYTSAKLDVKTKNFEMFWYTHHLFVPFYFCLFFHSYGCFVKSSTTGKCKGYNSNYGTIPIFCLYIAERLLREYRARLPTTLSKVIFHPGNTMELRIEKPSFQYKPGQYLFVNIPAVSGLQWHPFTISSTPEEGFVSVHVRIVGDWTKKTAKLLGCYQSGIPKGVSVPEIRIDGPYGAPAEDLYNYKVAVLIGAGIGVTPAASLLKSVWYKYYRKSQMPLQKLYFVWVNRDKEAFSWFQSLLASLEETVPTSFLEIHTYLTGNMAVDDIQNIALNINEEVDPLTELQTRTHYGRPDWKRIFQSVRANVPSSSGDSVDVGIFYCGPSVLAKVLGKTCHECTDQRVKFVLRKEHF